MRQEKQRLDADFDEWPPQESGVWEREAVRPEQRLPRREVGSTLSNTLVRSTGDGISDERPHMVVTSVECAWRVDSRTAHRRGEDTLRETPPLAHDRELPSGPGRR